MTWPTTSKNAWLNGQAFDFASMHTAFPGTTGTNEVAGGAPAYARKAIVVNAAAGGSRLLNAAVTFDVPASTVRWLGFWNAGVFVGCCANGGATPKNFVAQPSTDLVYSPGHGWVDGQKIAFFGVPPTGLTEGTTYFTVDDDRQLQGRGHAGWYGYRPHCSGFVRLRGGGDHRDGLRRAGHASANGSDRDRARLTCPARPPPPSTSSRRCSAC